MASLNRDNQICPKSERQFWELIFARALNLPLTIIDALADNVFYEAGKLKAENKISLADAIAIGEANVRGAELLTCDHHEFDVLVEEEKMTACWIR